MRKFERKCEKPRGLGGDSFEVVVARGALWSLEGLRSYFEIVSDIMSVENLVFNVDYWFETKINDYLEEAGGLVRVDIDLNQGEVKIGAGDLDDLELTPNGLVRFLNDLHVAHAKFLQVLLQDNIERERKWFWLRDLRAARAECDAANAATDGGEARWQVRPTFTVEPVPSRDSPE